MLRIGICDDEPDMSFDLLCQLERFLEGRGTAFEIQEFPSGDALLDWYGRNAGLLDLVFLDIEMAGHNGMATARELRRQDKSLQIVFVTGHPDYVFDGYSVGALGYLMKPAQAEQLADVVVRALV